MGRKVAKKKETIENPTKEEGQIEVKPQKETTLARGIDRMFDDFRRAFDDMMAPFLLQIEQLQRTPLVMGSH